MVQDYGLAESDWVGELYRTRVSWVPAYNHTVFDVRLHSTYTKDSLSDFLDSFWRFQKARLYWLVIKCERETMDRYSDERRYDHNSMKKPKFVLLLHLEAYTRAIYTATMFEMFQEELKASIRWIVKLVEKTSQFANTRL